MNEYALWIALAAIAAAYFFFRLRASISPADARKLLAEGGVVVDVRSPEEYGYQRLSRSINLPLGELSSRILKEVPSKDTPVLCHCASGARSSIAVGQLKRLGYHRAYNIGSLPRARSIVES